MKLEFSEITGRLLRKDQPSELGRSTLREALAALERGEVEEAKQMLEYARKEWEVVHDIYTNLIWALLTFIAKGFGEETLGRAFRSIFGSYYKSRYEKVMKLGVEAQLQLTLEGLRGHLMGPGRGGEIRVDEETDRYKLTLAPCGSGGVARQRVESGAEKFPEHYGFSQKAHPWTWGRESVCYYCGHCAYVNEILSIENFGHPMRITEYPANAEDPCVWYIYKDPKKIPAEYYERVGKKAPRPKP